MSKLTNDMIFEQLNIPAGLGVVFLNDIARIDEQDRCDEFLALGLDVRFKFYNKYGMAKESNIQFFKGFIEDAEESPEMLIKAIQLQIDSIFKDMTTGKYDEKPMRWEDLPAMQYTSAPKDL